MVQNMPQQGWKCGLIPLDNSCTYPLYSEGFSLSSRVWPHGFSGRIGLGQEWILTRNSLLAPQQLGQVFAILCALSLAIAFAFTLLWAWYIRFFCT